MRTRGNLLLPAGLHSCATAIERLLQVEVLAIENERQVFTAMVALKQGRGSFADVLIAELGVRVGCIRTLTFDRKGQALTVLKLSNRSDPGHLSQLGTEGNNESRDRACTHLLALIRPGREWNLGCWARIRRHAALVVTQS